MSVCLRATAQVMLQEYLVFCCRNISDSWKLKHCFGTIKTMKLDKKHKVIGSVLAVAGFGISTVGIFGTQLISADTNVGEIADSSTILIAGGGILVVTAIIILAVLFVSE